MNCGVCYHAAFIFIVTVFLGMAPYVLVTIGRGVEKSYTNARGLFDKSVEQGNADAQYHMAILLRKTDPFKAIGLINHAARQVSQ